MKNRSTNLFRGRIASLGTAMMVALTVPNLNAQTTEEPSPAGEPSEEDKVTDLPVYQVTGSRIKRVDTEAVSPVITIRSDELLNVGFPTIGDVLRSMPFNSGQALTPTDSGTSFTPGLSTMNLRGLGNNQTLVLVNGRRTAPYASPGFNGLQTMFDLNSLPAGAIERVEILKDGGSAIYGSDAVAGVVNIILRQDYEGLSTSMEFGNYFDTSALLKKAGIVMGASNERTSIMATVDWEEQEAVLARDLSYSRNADKSDLAPKANGRYTASGWEDVTSETFASEQEYLEYIGATDAIADGWFDNRSSRGIPGYLSVPGVGTRTFAEMTDNPTTAGAIPGVNYYNFQETAGLFPEYRRFSFYTTMKHELSDSLRAFAEVSFSRYETKSLAAATPVDLQDSHGLDSGDPMVYPGLIPYAYDEEEEPFQNPFNPWGVDVTNGRRRLIELPNRVNDITSDTPRVLVGLAGDLEQVGLSGWEWETGILYSRNTVTNLNSGSAADASLQQAMYGLTRLGDGSLIWDPSTHPSDRVYFNWFGQNEQAMADFLSIENPNSDSIEGWIYDAKATGTIAEIPGGSVGLAVGLEYRKEDFASVQTLLNATGGILGGSEGTSSFGKRDVTSAYAEFSIPIIKQVELQLAGRLEDYSDEGFHTATRPKLGIKIRPVDWLVLRASFGKSFKAPDLAYLYTAGSTSFSSYQVIDPVTGTQIDQIQIKTAGNPELQPELTDTWYAGVVFEAPDSSRLRGLQASVDYVDYDQKDLLAQLSDFYDYAEFLDRAADGDPLFADKVVRDSGTGEVLYIRDDYENLSTARYKGFDFSVSYRFDTENLGTFHTGVDATLITNRTINGDDYIGSYLIARWNGLASLGWTRGDWAINAYTIYRGKRHNDLTYGSIFDEGDTLYVSYDVKAQTTVNASIAYSGLRRTRVRLGINNLFNSDPPVDPFDGTGTTAGVNDPFPAFWYVRLEKDF